MGKGSRCIGLTTLTPSCAKNLEASASCNAQGLSMPEQGLLCLLHTDGLIRIDRHGRYDNELVHNSCRSVFLPRYANITLLLLLFWCGKLCFVVVSACETALHTLQFFLKIPIKACFNFTRNYKVSCPHPVSSCIWINTVFSASPSSSAFVWIEATHTLFNFLKSYS